MRTPLALALDLDLALALVILVATAAGCGSSSDAKEDASPASPSPASAPATTPAPAAGEDMGGTPDSMPADVAADDKQVPPMGRDKLEAWLALGHYKAWKCETEPHPGRAGSGHGANRICNNDKVATAPDAGEFPVGSASVKELFDGGGKLNGYAVALKTSAGTTGAQWCWYERIGSGTVADGQGTKGSAKSICVSCHARAGVDGKTGRDQLFTIVK